MARQGNLPRTTLIDDMRQLCRKGEVMLRKFVKSFLRQRGYEILGPPSAFVSQKSLAGLLQQERINLVLDVGANVGQFVDQLRGIGYTGRVVSFEPLAAAHALLRKRAEADANWTIADRTAVGPTEGSVEIHVSNNSVSSSILGMMPSHSEAAPESSYVGTETVQMNSLDNLCGLDSTDRVLLKVDVQGYEKNVLDGAHRTLENCRAVISEMSLIPLYDGQLLAREMWDLLAAQGFEAWSLESAFRNAETGRMLQLDGAFVRPSKEL
jgi:FkbM family methyltransferase